jgi:hypothetical protein
MRVLILHSGLLIENPDLALAPRVSHCSGTITDRMDLNNVKMGPPADRWHEPVSMEMHPVLFTDGEARYADQEKERDLSHP